MRLATVRINEGTRAGLVRDADIAVLPYGDVGELLAGGEDWAARAPSIEPLATVALEDADYAPLVMRPEKIICVGANYRDHVAEVGMALPEHPTLFAKFQRSLVGAFDDIVLPPNSACADWEVELGVVVGRTLRDADEAQALDAVAGYTVFNDVTMRDWQLRTTQFLQGKTFEATTPLGPFLVTPDEVDHARDLELTCRVDGECMQRSSTSQLVFSVGHVLAYISSFITLVPGDLIATGTPSGVGGARKPPVYLRDGQTLSSQIEGLGHQANRCRSAAVVDAV
jgi:acylpyruvate hydrolase